MNDGMFMMFMGVCALLVIIVLQQLSLNDRKNIINRLINENKEKFELIKVLLKKKGGN